MICDIELEECVEKITFVYCLQFYLLICRQLICPYLEQSSQILGTDIKLCSLAQVTDVLHMADGLGCFMLHFLVNSILFDPLRGVLSRSFYS